MTSPNDLAGSRTATPFVPFQLFAGEKEIVTNHGPVAASQNLAKYQVVAKNANGQLVAHDPSKSDGTEVAVGIMCQPITTEAGENPSAPYYVSGFFNAEALVWHASTDTLVKQQAAFAGTEIEIGTLYGAA